MKQILMEYDEVKKKKKGIWPLLNFWFPMLYVLEKQSGKVPLQ